MRVAICDDEPVFAQELKKQISAFCNEKQTELHAELFTQGTSLLRKCREGVLFDIIFMDINLGCEKDGIAYCCELREICPEVSIIFVTSLENRAIDGYDVNAYGFLAKRNYSKKLPILMNRLWKDLYSKNTLTITEKNGVSILPVKEVLWAESHKRHTLVHTVNSDYTDTRSIQNFAPLLSREDFVEAHKSIYVNIAKIKSVKPDHLTLANDTIVPVSRRYHKSVMHSIMKKVSE